MAHKGPGTVKVTGWGAETVPMLRIVSTGFRLLPQMVLLALALPVFFAVISVISLAGAACQTLARATKFDPFGRYATARPNTAQRT